MATMLGSVSKLAMIPKWMLASGAAWIILIALAARQRPLELAERLGGKATQVGTAVDRVQALLANGTAAPIGDSCGVMPLTRLC
ncbi:hypothetical protein [Tsukamurella tyrosinosolvens]|uniref:hypothetical protein n=1 Tax=Tsukamurella tyrosinosolvens TaxID=57704 RepID=UPI002DD43F33|nr:hypothetical protein [Tsukamurella tyrosinosolvens]MEC4613176.1 hypothetical protein [Tsukamurella tyrosinosolvens]